MKNKRNVKIFGELRYKNFILLEMKSKIIEFCEYPLILKIDIDGGEHEITFDMWVKYQDGSEELQIIDFLNHSESILNEDNTRYRKYKKISEWCITNNYIFNLISELDINKGMYYINNLRYLIGTIKRNEIPLLQRYVKILINKLHDDRIKIGVLIDMQILPNDIAFSVLGHGIYCGVLNADINDKILCYDTEVWLINENKH
jgi:hypothetical protein